MKTLEELKKYINLTAEEEEGIRKSLQTLLVALATYTTFRWLIQITQTVQFVSKQSLLLQNCHTSSTPICWTHCTRMAIHQFPAQQYRYPDRFFSLSPICAQCTAVNVPAADLLVRKMLQLQRIISLKELSILQITRRYVRWFYSSGGYFYCPVKMVF